MENVKISERTVHGVTVVYVKVPFTLNAHVGFFSLSGSYAETQRTQGVAHYLEHLFFKGTKNRDLFKISDDAALLGAEQNAYTSEYITHYYLNVPKVNLNGAVELLCDMMFNPLFPAEEIEKERTVIQEERKMYEDNPQYYFYEEMEREFFNFQAGHKIVGTKDTINSLTRDDFVTYHQSMYGLDTTILVVVSDLEEDDVFLTCGQHLKDHPFKRNGRVPVQTEIITSINREYVFERPNIQQTYLLGAFKGLGGSDQRKYQKACLLNAIGGGMYSLFFKELREKLGLCYTVWAFTYLGNADASACAAYCQTEPAKASLARDKMIEIIGQVKKNGLEQENFDCAKASQLGGFCREVSSVTRIANIIGKNIVLGVDTDFEKGYQEILDLTLDDVNEYAQEHLPEPDDIHWAQMNPPGGKNEAS